MKPAYIWGLEPQVPAAGSDVLCHHMQTSMLKPVTRSCSATADTFTVARVVTTFFSMTTQRFHFAQCNHNVEFLVDPDPFHDM